MRLGVCVAGCELLGGEFYVMMQDRNGADIRIWLRMMCTVPSGIALRSFLVMIPLGRWPLSLTLPLLHRVRVW